MVKKDKRIILISGPSGVGKGMIIDSLLRLFFPEFYNKDYRYRKDIKDLCIVPVYKLEKGAGGNAGQSVYGNSNGQKNYNFDCRGKKQEINLDELDQAIENHNATLIEAYYNTFSFLKNRYESVCDFSSTFISPLNGKEIKEMSQNQKGLEEYLSNLMLDSLIWRAQRDGKAFTIELNKELEQRAIDSVNEIKFAHNFRNIIPNHCYESDSRWRFPILIGEPKKVVFSLYDIIKTGNSSYAEKGGDWVDDQSPCVKIEVKNKEDPFESAKHFLDSSTGPGEGKYLIESSKKIDEEKISINKLLGA